MNFANAVKHGLSKSVPSMVNVAIANAQFHGIQLHLRALNSASGDCTFEAVADNISTRNCFTEVYNEGPEINRWNWMNEAESLVFDIPGGMDCQRENLLSSGKY